MNDNTEIQYVKKRNSVHTVANYIQKHPDATLKQIAKAFNTSYDNIKKLVQRAKKSGLLYQKQTDGKWIKQGLSEQKDAYVEELEMRLEAALSENDSLKRAKKRLELQLQMKNVNPAVDQVITRAPQFTTRPSIDDEYNFDQFKGMLLKHNLPDKAEKVIDMIRHNGLREQAIDMLKQYRETL